jgi:hypothetical protein
MSVMDTSFSGGSRSHNDKSANAYKFDIGTTDDCDNESLNDITILDDPNCNNWMFDYDRYFQSRYNDPACR